MIANYHTHTWRCGHAEGSEQDYVQQAVNAGLKTLGFSDHTPYDFFDAEPRNPSIRMKPEELPEYAAAIRKFANEYRDQIQIFTGVEAEYYPKYFPRTLEMLKENGIQYMILGQHFLGNEIGEPYCGRPCSDRKMLERYVAQTIEALDTGLFLYFAHPDLIHFVGSSSVYEREMRKLCQAAKRTGTPLEINLLGIRENRHYPNEQFWQIAAEEGSTVILGSDAHSPQHVVDPESERYALALVERLGLKCQLSIDEFCIKSKLCAAGGGTR
ncbi:MAG: histidinol-phosphatase [Oscillospiraceae bacterium]|nr:histidinol-phosphatase [Oscillospiraceae bacterium]